MNAYDLNAKQRLLSKIKVTDDGCWKWTGQLHKTGYGLLWYKNKMYWAHRLSVKLLKQEEIENVVVRHTCDNPYCVNPDHLLTGTQYENMQDAKQRGRLASLRGEKNGTSKLTDEQRYEICERYAEQLLSRRKGQKGGVSYTSVAERYGVDRAVITKLVQEERNLWKRK